ncbi:putative glycerol kinase 5 isoform X4 [Dermochelys coriacea]|uniref:putative glycerol kinase 5 isoform X4 n=1 Tax=Dermochelys coriacea TaxID=27794 RepID=UPI001CA7F3B2|nr:putative glycerol kinase 5 isoform X4 [Dermochelys coriacea]
MPRCKEGLASAAAGTYVVGVDVGSMVLRCHVYDQTAEVRGASSKKVETLHPHLGWVELDPEVLWTQVTDVIKEAVQAAGLQMNQIAGLGISTQRGTFITWNKKTGKPFHNFISWQDQRAAELVNSWNRGLILKAIHIISTILYFLTRSDRYLAASSLTFTTQHVSLRLSWILQNITEVQQAANENNCCFGTIDTWLLYKLTKDVVEFCFEQIIFNTDVYISSSRGHKVADQQAAMFGQCCFHAGDVKLTMGTGIFWDVNTGNHLHTPRAGLYPVIGWKIGKEVVFLAEGNASDAGSTIKWAKELDLFTSVDETSRMARSVIDSEGVCFVPSFSGLQVLVPCPSRWYLRASVVSEHLKTLMNVSSKKTREVPVNDPYACASFMGLKPSTTRNHLIRAVLESIAFRNKQLYDTFVKEMRVPLTNIRADGGVSNNSFIMQMTSDLINKKIDKPVNTDMSCLGAAFLAGLALGFWTDKEQLKKLRRTEIVFEPQRDSGEYQLAMDNWIKAVQRSLNWYSQTSY